jgi:hypothetical protein
MDRVWRHVLTGLSVAAAVTAAGATESACVHDDSTIFVSRVLAPPLVTAGMICTFTADPTQPSIASGVLDVALTNSYTAEFLVGNQMVPRGDPNQPQTETSYVKIEGAVVRIMDASTPPQQLASYTTLAALTLPPSSGTSPGYGPIAVTIINSATAAGFSMSSGGIRVTSYVRFFGHTLGGESVESNEFGFPVDVCSGCLIAFPPSEENLQLPTPNCALSNSSMMTATSVPCIMGQDYAIDCALCQSAPACRVNENGTPVAIVDAGGGG